VPRAPKAGKEAPVELTPDSRVLFEYGFVNLNLTIVYSWIVMVLLVGFSVLATKNLRRGPEISRWQNLLETIVGAIRNQVRDMTQQDPDRYLPFLGTLFLFILVSNVLSVVPGFQSPTGSLSTTTALALIVFFAVPIYGITKKGFVGYLKHYIQPTPIMLPFNIISELSRTLALAVRLFGNIMSGSMIVGVLLSIAPLFVPLIMQALGLLIGVIQAYIFAALATIYIASATRIQEVAEGATQPQQEGEQ
jgi:F-type H+-transporting ATPase subunit a